MVVAPMIGVGLLQRSEGGGLGIGGGGGFMTNRGTANVLTRTTAVLAGVFFLTSLGLSWLAGHDRAPTSIFRSGAPAGQTAPGGGALPPIAPGGSGGVLDTLRQQQGAPATPAPSGPQVPQSR
jgi:preprotein translocase subunit SecG